MNYPSVVIKHQVISSFQNKYKPRRCIRRKDYLVFVLLLHRQKIVHRCPVRGDTDECLSFVFMWEENKQDCGFFACSDPPFSFGQFPHSAGKFSFHLPAQLQSWLPSSTHLLKRKWSFGTFDMGMGQKNRKTEFLQWHWQRICVQCGSVTSWQHPIILIRSVSTRIQMQHLGSLSIGSLYSRNSQETKNTQKINEWK